MTSIPPNLLSTSVGGIALDCCVYNASGPRTGTGTYLEAIAKSRAGAVLSKSATPEARKGNPFPRYAEVDMGAACPGSINSEGLPNKGVDYYIDDELTSKLTATGKPYILSLSGLSLQDNLDMLAAAASAGNIAAIELNLACPNIPGKPTMAYDFAQMDEVLEKVCAHPAFGVRPLGVKLAPYFDFPHYQQAANVLNKYPIAFVVCTNTVGNGLLVNTETEEAVISPKGGFGGLAGGFIKNIALANVRQMRTLLRDDIDIVGVGGGAAAVQVGTRHYKEGAVCFDRIAGELEALMRRKGYTSLDDFRGKLKARSSTSTGAGGNKSKLSVDVATSGIGGPSSISFSLASTLCVAVVSAAVGAYFTSRRS